MIRNLLSFFLLGLSFAAPLAAQTRPNVVLVTLDTTRADRMGFLGSTRGLTPQLDALARQGTVFTRAYSQAPLTTVSHATLFTGTHPPFHGVHDFSEPLPADIPVLAELLRRQGYQTAAFVGALILDPVNGMAPGFNRGFDYYDAGYRLRRGKSDDRYDSLERRAEQVVARALAWLKGAAPGKPFFLWVHVFDPHEPYEAPGIYGRKHARTPYDGEIEYTDAQVGKLFEALRARGLFKNTLIAVASDHGEAFGEHGEYTHGVLLYDTTIHVPLLIKFHDGHWAGQRYDGRVGLVDVAPTILSAVGLPVPKEMQGHNLLRLLGRPPADLPSYAETQYPRRAFGWSSLESLRTGSFLYVRSSRPELYDQSADPGLKRDLAESSKAEQRRLAGQLEAFRARVSENRPAGGAKKETDPRLAEKLAALGYVSGGSATTAPDEELPNPRDKIDVANLMHTATLLVEQEEPARAIPILRKILSTDPQIFVAQMQLGLALSKLKDYRAAVEPLRRATELQPTAGPPHFALGRALLSVGDIPKAASQLEIAADLMPTTVGPNFYLATAYAALGRTEPAMQYCRKTLALDPNHYGANLVLGRMLTVLGQPVEGLPYMQKAVTVRPDSAEAHRLIADTYSRLGREQDAARHRAAASRLKPSAEPPG
jgi:arylsulfatase A-like enzyme/Tfp pilus assembly protein PilF